MEFKEDKVSFSVFFKFDPNNYFNNVELMKTYYFDENQEVTKVEASPINWVSDEKNSMKALKKKQKKSKNKKNLTKFVEGKEVKTTSTWEEVESFFKIFKSLNSKDVEDDYEISEEERESDFFKDDLFPNALNYFLNIIPIDNDDEEGEESDDEEADKKDKKHKSGAKIEKDDKKDEAKEKCKNQ